MWRPYRAFGTLSGESSAGHTARPGRTGPHRPALGYGRRSDPASLGAVATTDVIRTDSFPDLNDEVLFPRLSEGKLRLAGQARRAPHVRAR